jgi:hypothetical protein
MTPSMDSRDSWDNAAPEGRIDFDRLRAVSDELVRLTRPGSDFYYHANDLSLGFIPSLTFNVCLYLDFAAQTITPGTNIQQISPLAAWITQHWVRIFQPHSVTASLIFICVAFGFAVLAYLIRYGIFLAVGRRIQLPLKRDLERSQILSRFLDGWDQLPEISSYMQHLARRFIMWPIAAREKPTPVQRQVRTFVANLDWYIQPPRRLWRWQWINMAVRAVAGIACLAAQFASFGLNPGYNEPVNPAWARCLLVMLWSYLVFLATCLIPAVIPEISAGSRARILLSKLKPVFELLGPEPGKA